jgi:kynureninase
MGRMCRYDASGNIEVNISTGSLRDAFLLEEGAAYLNHGAFGATPRTVLAAADGWRRHLEAHPVRFRLWVRISAQIYNQIGDYRRLADALAA